MVMVMVMVIVIGTAIAAVFIRRVRCSEGKGRAAAEQ